MASQTPLSDRLEAGQTWLMSCSIHPSNVRRAWAEERLAAIVSGSRWRVAEAPLLLSVEAMPRIGAERLGPVMADISMNLAWWLLPADLGDELDDVRSLTVRPPGWVLACPPVLYSVDTRMWLERPDGSGRLTDPILLGAVLGPGGSRLAAEESG